MKYDIKIGDKYIDSLSGKEETVTKLTSNSIEITRTKISNKGIDSTHWFQEEKFFKQFNKA